MGFYVDPAKSIASNQSGHSLLILQQGIKQGDLALVKQFLSHKVDLNKALPNGELPLHFAVREDRPEIVTALLDGGANPELRDFQKLNAIDHAVLMKHGNILARILEKKFGKTVEHLEEQIKNKATATHAEALSVELKKKGKVNPETLSPICKAAYQGDLETLERLSDAVNETDKNGLSPIHYAILGKQNDAIELLCNLGADVSQTTKDGDGLLHFGVISGSKEIVAAMLEAGFDPNDQNLKGETALHYAAVQDKFPLVDLIVKHQGDPTLADHAGLSPWVMIGSSAYQKDPLSLSTSHLLLFAVSSFNWLAKLAVAGGWVRSDHAKFAVMAFGFASGLYKAWNDVDPAWKIIANHTCNFGLRQVPGLKLYYTAIKTYDICSAAWKGAGNFWNNIAYREGWAAARHIVVHGVNTAEITQKLQKNAYSTYEVAQDLFKLVVPQQEEQ